MTKNPPNDPAANSNLPISVACPACSYHVAVTFIDPYRQPLATVAWPSTEEEAKAMKQLPLSFVRCVDCGHIFNREFCYEEVPYSRKPHLMFNKGTTWTNHLIQIADMLLGYVNEGATVVEIGCGEGHLLRHMASKKKNCRFYGFDPNASYETDGLFEGRSELFVPEIHMEQLQPDLIISRHVMEHLINPLGFLQSIQFNASRLNLRTRVYIETPCIDRALETGRVGDFYYEHNSHFTTQSFTRMIQRTSHEIDLLTHSYNREVLSGLFRVGTNSHAVELESQADDFRIQAKLGQDVLTIQLDQLKAKGKSIAIWGGTGKASAFINFYRLDAKSFPIVVDSDPDKTDTHVPGQGQPIQYRDYLKDHPVDVILIPMAWRAHDVLLEMQEAGIRCDQVLIEYQGRLVDYFHDDHPYHVPGEVTAMQPPAPHYNPQSQSYWTTKHASNSQV